MVTVKVGTYTGPAPEKGRPLPVVGTPGESGHCSDPGDVCETGLAVCMQVLERIPKSRTLRAEFLRRAGSGGAREDHGHGHGEWTVPPGTGWIQRTEGLLGPHGPPPSPRGPGCSGAGVHISASAVSHAASCNGETRSPGEAITGTDPGQTRKPALGVSPGPAPTCRRLLLRGLGRPLRPPCAPGWWGGGDPAPGGPTGAHGPWTAPPDFSQMVKNWPAMRRPGLERSPGGRRGNPLQYSCLENPHGQRLKSERKVKSLSCVRLFVTPWTVAHQAPLSMEFCRPEYWRDRKGAHV